MPNRLLSFFLLSFLLGCRFGVSETEQKSLETRNLEWNQIIEYTELDFLGIAERHESFMHVLYEPGLFARKPGLNTDTTFMLQRAQLQSNFARLQRNHIYNLKQLRIWSLETANWVKGINLRNLTPSAVRRQWAARQSHFLALVGKAKQTETAFESLSASYLALRPRIL